MTVWGFCSTQAFGPNVVTGQGPCRERVLLRGEGGRGGDVRRGRPAGCKRHALRAVSVRATPSCGRCVPETLPGLQSRPECARCPGGGSKWRHSEHLEVLRTRTRPRTGARELGSGLESDFVPVLPPPLPAPLTGPAASTPGPCPPPRNGCVARTLVLLTAPLLQRQGPGQWLAPGRRALPQRSGLERWALEVSCKRSTAGLGDGARPLPYCPALGLRPPPGPARCAATTEDRLELELSWAVQVGLGRRAHAAQCTGTSTEPKSALARLRGPGTKSWRVDLLT